MVTQIGSPSVIHLFPITSSSCFENIKIRIHGGDITQPFIVPFIPPACRFMTINNPATSITSSPTSIAENVNVTSINVTHSSLFQKVTR